MTFDLTPVIVFLLGVNAPWAIIGAALLYVVQLLGGSKLNLSGGVSELVRRVRGRPQSAHPIIDVVTDEVRKVLVGKTTPTVKPPVAVPAVASPLAEAAKILAGLTGHSLIPPAAPPPTPPAAG